MAATTASQVPSNLLLGPLTTTFTPPAHCNVLVASCQTCSIGWFAQKCDPRVGDDPSCWPSRIEGVATPTYSLRGWGYYSPGVICPSGYVSACSATGGMASGFDFGFNLAVGETAVGCCQSGLVCHSQATCSVTVSSTTFAAVSCESSTSGDFSYITLPFTTEGVTSSTYILNGPMIQMVWQASDRMWVGPSAVTTGISATPTSPEFTSRTSASPKSTSSISTSPTSTLPISQPTQKGHSGLSTGAQAGIGVAGALAGIALISALLLYFRLRLKYVSVKTHPTDDLLPNASKPSRWEGVAELPGIPLSRTVASTPTSELPARESQ